MIGFLRNHGSGTRSSAPCGFAGTAGAPAAISASDIPVRCERSRSRNAASSAVRGTGGRAPPPPSTASTRVFEHAFVGRDIVVGFLVHQVRPIHELGGDPDSRRAAAGRTQLASASRQMRSRSVAGGLFAMPWMNVTCGMPHSPDNLLRIRNRRRGLHRCPESVRDVGSIPESYSRTASKPGNPTSFRSAVQPVQPSFQKHAELGLARDDLAVVTLASVAVLHDRVAANRSRRPRARVAGPKSPSTAAPNAPCRKRTARPGPMLTAVSNCTRSSGRCEQVAARRNPVAGLRRSRHFSFLDLSTSAAAAPGAGASRRRPSA